MASIDLFIVGVAAFGFAVWMYRFLNRWSDEVARRHGKEVHHGQ